MKSLKFVITLASAVIILSAAVCAVVIFQEELTKLFNTCKDYCCKVAKTAQDEYSDFADM